jgi:hypothetical protein
MTTYKTIGDNGKDSEWIYNGMLYVKITNTQYGMLEQGGYADRVYAMPYTGSMDDARKTNDWGISDINRCIESGKVVREGRLIH